MSLLLWLLFLDGRWSAGPLTRCRCMLSRGDLLQCCSCNLLLQQMGEALFHVCHCLLLILLISAAFPDANLSRCQGQLCELRYRAGYCDSLCLRLYYLTNATWHWFTIWLLRLLELNSRLWQCDELLLILLCLWLHIIVWLWLASRREPIHTFKIVFWNNNSLHVKLFKN